MRDLKNRQVEWYRGMNYGNDQRYEAAVIHIYAAGVIHIYAAGVMHS
jgi:hypothetical protein